MKDLLELLNSLTMRQKIAIVLAVVVTGAGIFAFVRMKKEDDFKPLYTDLKQDDAAKVVQRLQETGTEYRLEKNGSTILIPSKSRDEMRLRLASEGLPKTGRIGFELFDQTNFGTTEFTEQVNYKRALEGELERSVMSMEEVETARVHLTIPKKSVFLEQQLPGKASVMLKLRPGTRMTPVNLAAVANLVSSAVEGMTPESVSIMDMQGNLLSRPRKPGDPIVANGELIEIRQHIERDLEAKVRATLEPLTGPDRLAVSVSVECDLSSEEVQEERYDPAASALTNSQKSQDTTDRLDSSGVPGTPSNLPNPPVPPARNNRVTTKSSENLSFQPSRVVRHTKIPQGVIRRMSVSVAVDHVFQMQGEGAARRRVLVPPTPENLESIRSLVAAATGYNEERGDQLTVESLPFHSSLTSEPPKDAPPAPSEPTDPWSVVKRWAGENWIPLAVGTLVVLAGLFALVMQSRSRAAELQMLRARMEAEPVLQLEAPAEVEEVEPMDKITLSLPAPEPEPEVVLSEKVNEFAMQNPEYAANVIRMWLREDGESN